jgi:hypothetical protein
MPPLWRFPLRPGANCPPVDRGVACTGPHDILPAELPGMFLITPGRSKIGSPRKLNSRGELIATAVHMFGPLLSRQAEQERL